MSVTSCSFDNSIVLGFNNVSLTLFSFLYLTEIAFGLLVEGCRATLPLSMASKVVVW